MKKLYYSEQFNCLRIIDFNKLNKNARCQILILHRRSCPSSGWFKSFFTNQELIKELKRNPKKYKLIDSWRD